MTTAQTVLVAVISSGALSALIQCSFSIIQKNQDLTSLQGKVNQEVLLWLIKDRGKKALAEGCITHEELEDLTRVYTLYHKIGGNGFAEAVMSKVKALPLKES